MRTLVGVRLPLPGERVLVLDFAERVTDASRPTHRVSFCFFGVFGCGPHTQGGFLFFVCVVCRFCGVGDCCGGCSVCASFLIFDTSQPHTATQHTQQVYVEVMGRRSNVLLVGCSGDGGGGEEEVLACGYQVRVFGVVLCVCMYMALPYLHLYVGVCALKMTHTPPNSHPPN